MSSEFNKADFCAITKPLASIDELLSWDKSSVPSKYKARPVDLHSIKIRQDPEPQFLVCHDLDGNYHEDR